MIHPPISYTDRFASIVDSDAYETWYEDATSLDAAKAVAEVMFCGAANALHELGFNLKDDALDEVLARRIVSKWNMEDLAHAAVAVGYCNAFDPEAAAA